MGKLHARINKRIGTTNTPISVVTDAIDVYIDPSQNPDLPESAETVQDIVDTLGELAFLTELPTASTSEAGIVQLTSSTSDTTATDKAATGAALASVNAGAVHTTTNESIAGTKTFTDSVIIGDVTFSRTNNELHITPVVTPAPTE